MLIGYQTRLVALGLAIYVLVAAFIAHAHFWRRQPDFTFLQKHAATNG